MSAAAVSTLSLPTTAFIRATSATWFTDETAGAGGVRVVIMEV